MPFWWRRRKRPWFYRKRRFTNYYSTKRRRRRYRRKKYRRPARRRRRRRRRKVRRKRQTIPLVQWQPDSIVNCKIIGLGTLVLGSQGKQFLCFTQNREDYVPPKTPYGGGFGAELYSLQYLYEEYKFRRNVWTKTNILKDLCRFLRCKIIFFRHPEIDFVVAYERMPPFHIEKYTYTSIHPSQLLLQKHKKIILSRNTKPNGKLTKRMLIKPPKQMINKWFFTDHFCKFPLFFLKGSACDFRYSNLGCCNESPLSNIYFLNLTYFANTNWGLEQATTIMYTPHANAEREFSIDYVWKGKKYTNERISIGQTWQGSISYNEGWFQYKVLNATKIYNQASLPLSVGRYSPQADTGEGNKIYFVSVTSRLPVQPTDTTLVYQGLPIWLMLYGFSSYINLVKQDKTFLKTHFLVIETSAIYIYNTTQTVRKFIVVDPSFINGLAPYDIDPTQTQKQYWYPTYLHQQKTINNIVSSGPYIPKLDQVKNSTWELDYKYCFYFKWGGPQITDQEVADPSKLPDYEVPDHLAGTVQITNPSKQKAASYLHPWDHRRGIITQRAFKRISENLSIDTDFYPDAEPPQKKKRITAQLRTAQEKEEEIQTCLQELCEENICQEQTEDNLLNLIQQQREQQQQLKRNLLVLLSDMKKKQRMLQLQTGLIE